MCGFAGVVAWSDRYRVDEPALRRMADAVAHRGPDGTQCWRDDRCALAFCRLAILDLDPRAMQPMTDGRRWLVFNGEIYNFRDLRAELTRRDPAYAWRTTGDSETILRAFDAWGEDCVEHLNGMFALAIWEPETGRLFLARDRMGQKPLFLAASPDGGAVAFASELPALRALNWPNFGVDSRSIAEYLQTGYIAAPATVYRGVRKLPPATWQIFAADGSRRARVYFDANEPAHSGPPDVKSTVTTAVARQLVSDVPLGCFLSGGIDSSVIAAAMKRAVEPGQRVLTFSIGFDDPQYDETSYAAAVARRLGTEHRQFTVHPDATADLPRLAAVFGEPFGDSSALPTHYLAQQTRQHVKVALSGDGGDELFGGYDRYRAMRHGGDWHLLATLARRGASLLPGAHPKSPAQRLRRFTQGLGLPAAQRYAQYVSLFDEAQCAELFASPPLRHVVRETYEQLQDGRDAVETALATDRVTYLPEDLLTKVDRASMLHALEVRSPLMDPQVVALAAGLRTDQLLTGGGKRPLREAFAADLPDFVFRRRKMGFAVPIGQWLRGSLRPMLHDLLDSTHSFAANHFNSRLIARLREEHQAERIDHSQRLYALLMLELWWRTAQISV